jgi:hypothetical protein
MAGASHCFVGEARQSRLGVQPGAVGALANIVRVGNAALRIVSKQKKRKK